LIERKMKEMARDDRMKGQLAAEETLQIVILGLAITSSWGNGHATTYRGLVRELSGRGHNLLFLERDVPWYASQRDLPFPPYCRTELYTSLEELKEKFGQAIRSADLVIVGSYVPEGAALGEWVTREAEGVTAFYDIDTPITLARLKFGAGDYLTRELIPRYDLYLSFAGGPVLKLLEESYGSPMARPLFCAVDPELHFPERHNVELDLGYMGTYSADRQPGLEELMLKPAAQWREGRFIVAGPQFPPGISWPRNVQRVEHISPREHRFFYNSQRFTLNLTRADMKAIGYSPSVRLFEAAACATPVISDWWPGLDEFFLPGKEILISKSSEETLSLLKDLPDSERTAIGANARERVLLQHTSGHRALELETWHAEAGAQKAWKARSAVQ
jgi:spore maturation protein CgeB